MSPVSMSLTKESRRALVSKATRLLATESNATHRPSADMEMANSPEGPLAARPSPVWDANSTLPVPMSFLNTWRPTVPSGIRFVATEEKRTYRPSLEISVEDAKSPESPFPWMPSAFTDIR